MALPTLTSTATAWTKIPTANALGGAALAWAPVNDTPHAVYLMPDGRLVHE